MKTVLVSHRSHLVTAISADFACNAIVARNKKKKKIRSWNDRLAQFLVRRREIFENVSKIFRFDFKTSTFRLASLFEFIRD